MCTRAGLLVGFDYAAKRALVARANCESWSCPECARRMAERWVLRAQIGVRKFQNEGRSIRFVTITGHEKLKTFEATQAVWREAWPVLYAAVKRRCPDLQYFMVPEKHKDGRMHVHILWTSDVSQRWVKDNARKRGLGYQAKVKTVENAGHAAKYVTKYVGKDLGENVPKRTRRVAVSQGWPDIPEPKNELSALRWEYVNSNGALAVIYAECQAKHLDLIEVGTGEKFDDIDLGTIIDPDFE